MSSTQPDWSHSEVRIKPEPKPDVVMYGAENNLRIATLSEDGVLIMASTFTSKQTPVDRVKYTFDGETGKLKSVEMIDVS